MEKNLQSVTVVTNYIRAFAAPNATDSTEVKIAKMAVRYGVAITLSAAAVITFHDTPALR
jgi:hypothetical protein